MSREITNHSTCKLCLSYTSLRRLHPSAHWSGQHRPQRIGYQMRTVKRTTNWLSNVDCQTDHQLTIKCGLSNGPPIRYQMWTVKRTTNWLSNVDCQTDHQLAIKCGLSNEPPIGYQMWTVKGTTNWLSNVDCQTDQQLAIKCGLSNGPPMLIHSPCQTLQLYTVLWQGYNNWSNCPQQTAHNYAWQDHLRSILNWYSIV